MQKWGMSYANQDELVTLAGGLTANHYWRNGGGTDGQRTRQARADLGIPLVPLAFPTGMVTKKQEPHHKRVQNHIPSDNL